MRTISLRKFRDSIPEIGAPVDVQRRDKDGNFQMLGRWTPFVLSIGTKPLEPLPEGFQADGYVGPGIENLTRALATGRVVGTSFNSRPFTPVPKKGK